MFSRLGRTVSPTRLKATRREPFERLVDRVDVVHEPRVARSSDRDAVDHDRPPTLTRIGELHLPRRQLAAVRAKDCALRSLLGPLRSSQRLVVTVVIKTVPWWREVGRFSCVISIMFKKSRSALDQLGKMQLLAFICLLTAPAAFAWQSHAAHMSVWTRHVNFNSVGRTRRSSPVTVGATGAADPFRPARGSLAPAAINALVATLDQRDGVNTDGPSVIDDATLTAIVDAAVARRASVMDDPEVIIRARTRTRGTERGTRDEAERERVRVKGIAVAGTR